VYFNKKGIGQSYTNSIRFVFKKSGLSSCGRKPLLLLVRVEGLEPAHLSAPDPKSGVSTNFTTPAVPIFSNWERKDK
jgi:hypothetical protein